MTRIAPSSGIATACLFVGLFGVTGVLGLSGNSVARYLFLAGSTALGWHSWRIGPQRHLKTAVALFAFSPFLRRIVDLGCGFDPSSLLLAGPLLAIALPCVDVLKLLGTQRRLDGSGPNLVAALCLGYGSLVSVMGGDVAEVVVPTFKWSVPIVYGYWIALRTSEGHDLARALVLAFAWIGPLIGLYAIWQYVQPPDWDGLWMLHVDMSSNGDPLPYQVRVFSTLNSPASFASYAACGILLMAFCIRRWWAILLCMPLACGLVLSLFRTAWLSFSVGVLFCACFSATRKRAFALVILLGAGAFLAIASGWILPDLTKRFDTLSLSPEQDGSVRMRLYQFREFYENAEHLAVGTGLARTLSSDNGVDALLDGTVMHALVGMGDFVGPIMLVAIAWAALRAIVRAPKGADAEFVVVAAFMMGELIQVVLSSVTEAECGFLFWTFAGIGCAVGQDSGPIRRPGALQDQRRPYSITAPKLTAPAHGVTQSEDS
jgi:hypothetical protein